MLIYPPSSLSGAFKKCIPAETMASASHCFCPQKHDHEIPDYSCNSGRLSVDAIITAGNADKTSEIRVQHGHGSRYYLRNLCCHRFASIENFTVTPLQNTSSTFPKAQLGYGFCGEQQHPFRD